MAKVVSKVSTRGQVVVPAKIREELRIEEGTILSFSVQPNGQILVEKVPDELDWDTLLADIPIVDIENSQEVEEFVKDWE